MSIKLIIGKNSTLAAKAILMAEKNGVEVIHQESLKPSENSQKPVNK